MYLLFKSYAGAKLAKNVSLLFIFYYINIISSSILQAIGEVKIILTNSLFSNILRLFLILVLPFFPTINANSILYSIIICLFISAIFNLTIVLYKTKLKISISNIFKYLLIFLLSFSLLILFTHFKINYFISSIFIIILNFMFFILIIRKKI